MDPFVNHCDHPFVTAQVMVHSEALKFLPRALASLRAQDLDHGQIELQVVFDGKPTPAEEEFIEGLTAEGGWYGAGLVASGRKFGYYTAPRNMATALANGLYVAHLDADNEWKPGHLSTLLGAIRVPDADGGWPHFVYGRREYVLDKDDLDGLPVGPSPLMEWTPESAHSLTLRPGNNFVDTGDFLVGLGTLHELAERSGCVWDSNMRRFGDWDLISRMIHVGMRGRAVDCVSHIYHWTGDNVQLNRPVSDISSLDWDVYESLKRQGKIRA